MHKLRLSKTEEKSIEVVVGIEISPFYSGSNHMDGIEVVQ